MLFMGVEANSRRLPLRYLIVHATLDSTPLLKTFQIKRGMQRARSTDVNNAKRIVMALLRPSSVEGESPKPKQRHEGG